MDKTFSDLMDIVNRSKKYDTGTPKPRPKRVEPVEEDYAPIEYDVQEEKPKRKTATKSSSSTFSNTKLGELISKTTKKPTAKKSTSTKSATTSTTQKKTAPKKTTTKSTTAKSTTKKTETKKTAPKTDKLSALMNKVSSSKKIKDEKVDKPEEKPSIMDTAPEVTEAENNIKNFEFPKFEARPKVKPAKSITDKEPTNNQDAQLFAALKNSLFSGGTDISEYLNESEALEISQQTYEDNKLKQEANKLNEEISKEQQEYEQLFTGSFSSFYDMANNEEETETFARDEKNPHDSTYELDTGNRNLDQKIADYYKRKQQMIDKYNAEEENYEEKPSRSQEEPIDYDSIFSGTVVSRDEALGLKNVQRKDTVEEDNEPVSEENPVFTEYLARNTEEYNDETQTNETNTTEENSTSEETVELEDNKAETEEVNEELQNNEEETNVETTDTVSEENIENETQEINEDNLVEDTSSEVVDSNEEKSDEVVTGDNFVMTPSEQPAGEIIEYSNQVPVDMSNLTKVEDIIDNETTEENKDNNQLEGKKSLLSSLVSNISNKTTVNNEDDDDEELVIKLENNEYAETNQEDTKAHNDDNDIVVSFTEESDTEQDSIEPIENTEEYNTNTVLNDTENEEIENTEEEKQEKSTPDQTIEEVEKVNEETIDSTYYSSMFDANSTSLDDDNSIVVDSENTISSLNLEELNQKENETKDLHVEEYNEETSTKTEEKEEQEETPAPDQTIEEVEEVENLEEVNEEDNIENEVETFTTIENQVDNSLLVEDLEEENSTSEEVVELEDNKAETEEVTEELQNNEEETSTETSDTTSEDNLENNLENNQPIVEETVTENAPEDNSIFTLEQETEESNEDKELLETYLSEDEQYDYIVTNERLFEEKNKPQKSNNDNYYVDDLEDNTFVMNDAPNTSFDLFKTGYVTEEKKETPVVETVATEETKEDSNTISKEEFYKEMARLQDNIISELQGNIVEKSSHDFFEDKTTEVNTAPIVTNNDSKANSLVDELIKEAEKEEEELSIVEQVLAKDKDNTNLEESKTTTAEVESIKEETPVVEEKTVAEEKSVDVSLVGSMAEPVDPADFDKYNLLNKTVALSEEDLKPREQEQSSEEKQENYFYGSNEDKEKKNQIIDEYMTIYNEEAHISKEVGDINIFKNIANAIPSSQLIKEDKEEQTNEKMEKEGDDELEAIYTLMGIQRKTKTVENKEIKVLYCASECQPFAASGGLADVAGSLPKAIVEKGDIDIRVIMPLYSNIKNEYRDQFEYLGNFTVHLSWRQEYCGLFRYFKDGVTYYFIDNERYFKRDKLYGYYDDGERFAYFSKAIVEALPHLNFFPDIIHCNDWQTALVSAYVKTGNWSDHRYYKIRYVYTIHNVEYQGVYGMENLKDLFGIDYRFKNDVEYNGDINLTKTAIQYCDKLTTVSNSYCDNLKQPYCSRGLHHAIIRNEYKLSGIINGIDYNFYNPASDPNLFKNYDIGCVEEKVLNKKLWQDEIGLPVDADTPMIAIVSRLVGHKGLDLISKIVYDILQQDVQLVVVGTGDDKYVDLFHSLEQKYPTKVRAFVDKYSNEIARKAYAASDIFVMPSKIEPCGLSQMISSRYGSVPIVREVGGLKDTIRDFGCEGGGNGYTFTNYNANDLKYQIERAIKDYSNKTQWREKMKICMSQDYTWGKPATSYIDLYKSISSN